MTRVIGKTIEHNGAIYKKHDDGSYTVWAFGSFPFQKAPGLIWKEVAIPVDKVPKEVKECK